MHGSEPRNIQDENLPAPSLSQLTAAIQYVQKCHQYTLEDELSNLSHIVMLNCC